MKIKKEYEYTNNRQIWRLLPTDTEKLVIEDRDTETREVFFNCLDINSGQIIFENYQLDEKYWTGIEAVYKDIIFFHKFGKPDMPGHLGITACNINSHSVLWHTDDYIFLLALNDRIYCYKNTFDGRIYYALDYKTGELVEDMGNDSAAVNLLRGKSSDSFNYDDYLFPSPFNPEEGEDELVEKFLTGFKNQHTITGRIELVKMGDALLFNYHEVLQDGGLTNKFTAIDILSKKVIFEDTLDSRTKAFVPDSFFVKEKLIFLLKEKNNLSVCSLNY